MKLRLLFLSFFIMASFAMFAQNMPKPTKIPARRDSIEFCQPNSEKVYIILHGDEYKHFQTTTDGFVIKKNKKGYICYAKQTCCGTIKASNRIARNICLRTKFDNRYLKRIQNNPNLYIYKRK